MVHRRRDGSRRQRGLVVMALERRDVAGLITSRRPPVVLAASELCAYACIFRRLKEERGSIGRVLVCISSFQYVCGDVLFLLCKMGV